MTASRARRCRSTSTKRSDSQLFSKRAIAQRATRLQSNLVALPRAKPATCFQAGCRVALIARHSTESRAQPAESDIELVVCRRQRQPRPAAAAFAEAFARRDGDAMLFQQLLA